jgi:hypothetical protein
LVALNPGSARTVDTAREIGRRAVWRRFPGSWRSRLGQAATMGSTIEDPTTDGDVGTAHRICGFIRARTPFLATRG